MSPETEKYNFGELEYEYVNSTNVLLKRGSNNASASES